MSTDPHKVFVDKESYNYGHGHAYKFYGVDEQKGAIVVVRPDQRKPSQMSSFDAVLTLLRRCGYGRRD